MVLSLTLSKFFKLVSLTFVSVLSSTNLSSRHRNCQVSPFGPGIGSKAEGFVPEVSRVEVESERWSWMMVGCSPVFFLRFEDDV